MERVQHQEFLLLANQCGIPYNAQENLNSGVELFNHKTEISGCTYAIHFYHKQFGRAAMKPDTVKIYNLDEERFEDPYVVKTLLKQSCCGVDPYIYEGGPLVNGATLEPFYSETETFLVKRERKHEFFKSKTEELYSLHSGSETGPLIGSALYRNKLEKRSGPSREFVGSLIFRAAEGVDFRTVAAGFSQLVKSSLK